MNKKTYIQEKTFHSILDNRIPKVHSQIKLTSNILLFTFSIHIISYVKYVYRFIFLKKGIKHTLKSPNQ